MKWRALSPTLPFRERSSKSPHPFSDSTAQTPVATGTWRVERSDSCKTRPIPNRLRSARRGLWEFEQRTGHSEHWKELAPFQGTQIGEPLCQCSWRSEKYSMFQPADFASGPTPGNVSTRVCVMTCRKLVLFSKMSLSTLLSICVNICNRSLAVLRFLKVVSTTKDLEGKEETHNARRFHERGEGRKSPLQTEILSSVSLLLMPLDLGTAFLENVLEILHLHAYVFLSSVSMQAKWIKLFPRFCSLRQRTSYLAILIALSHMKSVISFWKKE